MAWVFVANITNKIMRKCNFGAKPLNTVGSAAVIAPGGSR